MYKGMEVGKSNSCSGLYTQEDIDALQEWSDCGNEISTGLTTWNGGVQAVIELIINSVILIY